ncbi:MAG: hypothetical protein IPJ19_20350 [Planctomycetes bacterium]|nr:hypothetical protein [Planctomycetota bacterium]
MRTTNAKPKSPEPLDREILARLARGARGGVLEVEHAAKLLKVPTRRAALILGRLARKHWIARVRRGTYILLPLEADPRRSVQAEDPWILAAHLFAPCYIGGWSAAEHWELTEQVFRSTFVVSAANIRARSLDLAGLSFRVVAAAPKRSASATSIWRGSEKIAVSSRESTIADALDHPDWLGGIRNVASALARLHQSPHWDRKRLAAAMEHLGRGSAFKRLGFLLETLHLDEPALIKLCLRERSSGLIALDPGVAKKGTISSRWNLRVNVSLGEREADS